MNDKSFAKEYIAPVLVLFCICLVVSFALAKTYGITKPQIDKIKKENEDAARSLVLPAAASDGFTLYDGTLAEGIIECYTANNGSGIAATATYKSFGGTITVMVGVDADGAVSGVTVMDHSDTPGLGTKAMTAEYLSQYSGKTELSAEKIKQDANVDAITGASISSNAVYNCVKEAIAQYSEMGGVGK